MSELKATPGPWEWDAGDVGEAYSVPYSDVFVDAGNTIIASFNDGIPEGRANACLIAAAPDLYAALDELVYMIEAWEKAVRQVIETDPAHGMNLEKAKSALAKARGETE